ncbi:MAG: hypothetical protein IKP65_05510 [Alphaproteobacteria bacterium]|nr:hypothetical protein [Alphaproteobacteria bacterium]
MTGYCKYCKFCEKQSIPVVNKDFNPFDDFEEKYFCRFMPNEIEVEEYHWCGQFKKKDEN